MQKQHPILFSTAMVEALLDGRKTMTRRINGLKEINENPNEWEDVRFWDGYQKFWQVGNAVNERHIRCPYGQPGDILYVRETWQHTRWALNMSLTDENSGYIYKASENGRDWEQNDENWKWKPGIHLPKEGSRIWLEITDVRVERLQDISEEDAKAEGIMIARPVPSDTHPMYVNYQIEGAVFNSASNSFQSLWDKINGEKHPWDSNPWLWVVQFRVLSTTGKPNS